MARKLDSRSKSGAASNYCCRGFLDALPAVRIASAWATAAVLKHRERANHGHRGQLSGSVRQRTVDGAPATAVRANSGPCQRSDRRHRRQLDSLGETDAEGVPLIIRTCNQFPNTVRRTLSEPRHPGKQNAVLHDIADIVSDA